MKGFLFQFATYLFRYYPSQQSQAQEQLVCPAGRTQPYFPGTNRIPEVKIWMAIFSLAYDCVQEQLTTSAFGPHFFTKRYSWGCSSSWHSPSQEEILISPQSPRSTAAHGASFFIIWIVGNFNNMVTAFFVSGAYTACSISYHDNHVQHVLSIWNCRNVAFGIERTVRMAFNAE